MYWFYFDLPLPLCSALVFLLVSNLKAFGFMLSCLFQWENMFLCQIRK